MPNLQRVISVFVKKSDNWFDIAFYVVERFFKYTEITIKIVRIHVLKGIRHLCRIPAMVLINVYIILYLMNNTSLISLITAISTALRAINFLSRV